MARSATLQPDVTSGSSKNRACYSFLLATIAARRPGRNGGVIWREKEEEIK
ncbi:hypothetical protein HMPREF9538_04328, partial [Klebsiella sp. MS 92-3]